MPTTPQHLAWTDIPVETLNPLLTRRFVHGEQAMLTRFELAKGCIVPLHSHANEQISHIVTGALLFKLGPADAPTEYTVRSGEVIVIPGNVPHSAETLEDTLAFDIFAPPRQDWINGTDAYLRG